jgi:hypothetical protein
MRELEEKGTEMRNNFMGYISTVHDNLETFLKNYSKTYLEIFNILIYSLQAIWERLGRRRDLSGNSHLGLLYFVNYLVRHAIFGFQHISTYQSFLCWLTFRPGLEAFLILGKFVDDPHNAEIWKNRENDKEGYIRIFQRELVSRSLPQSTRFRQVLVRLNDQFMHPNPDFVYRDTKLLRESNSTWILTTEYFDTPENIEVYESHLLAYLNLLDKISLDSDKLVNDLFGPAFQETKPKSSFEQASKETAVHLANSNPLCKRILEELGLWEF